MADSSEPSEPSPDAEDGQDPPEDVPEAPPSPDPETLRERVEREYDFERFTPADMAEMTVEEWEAVFDADSWITGPALLDRVEAELRSRVARREVFAVVERTVVDGEDRVLAYNDVGYALVGADGTVEGEGGIVADVEPVVALCSMDDYDVSEPPADAGLPDPADVTEGTGGLGDRLLLAVAGVQVVTGLLLLASPLLVDLNPGGSSQGAALLTTVAGLGFLFIGVVIGVLVANARLSGRFRAAEYRERLRAAGVGSDERPSFLPGEGTNGTDDAGSRTGGVGGAKSGRTESDEPPEPAPE